MKIPSILFDLIFVVITSLFILLDYSRIERLVVKRYEMVALIIDTIKEVLSNLFKAYFIIMIISNPKTGIKSKIAIMQASIIL